MQSVGSQNSISMMIIMMSSYSVVESSGSSVIRPMTLKELTLQFQKQLTMMEKVEQEVLQQQMGSPKKAEVSRLTTDFEKLVASFAQAKDPTSDHHDDSILV